MATANRRASDKTAKAAAAAKAAQNAPLFSVELLKQIVAATVANGFIYTKGDDNAEMLAAGLVEINAALTNDAGEVATRATADGMKYVEELPKEEGDANAANDAADTGAVVTNNQSETEGNSNTMNTATNLPAATLAAVAVASAFAIDNDIPPPSGAKRRVGGEKYPFDALQPGQSFFVPATDDNPNPAKSLASTVSSATARYAVQVGNETETITRAVYKLGEDGKRVKENGAYVKTGEETVTVPKMQNTRVFMVRPVDETAQGRGKGARVWRTA